MKRQKTHYSIGLLKLACGAKLAKSTMASNRPENITCATCTRYLKMRSRRERRSKDERYYDGIDRYVAGVGPFPER